MVCTKYVQLICTLYDIVSTSPQIFFINPIKTHFIHPPSQSPCDALCMCVWVAACCLVLFSLICALALMCRLTHRLGLYPPGKWGNRGGTLAFYISFSWGCSSWAVSAIIWRVALLASAPVSSARDSGIPLKMWLANGIESGIYVYIYSPAGVRRCESHI